MKPKEIFGREPVVWLNTAQAVLLLGVALGIPHITSEAVPLIVSALGALLGAAQALFVRPVAPAAFTAVVTALAPLLGYYGVGMSEELVVAVNGAIVAVLALVTRQQVSPIPTNAEKLAVNAIGDTE